MEDANKQFLSEILFSLGESAEDFGRARSVARGGERRDPGKYNSMREAIKNKFAAKRQKELDAQNQLKQAEEDAYTKKKREREDTVFSRDTQDYERAQSTMKSEDSPDSEISRSYQALASRVSPGKDYSSVSATQLKSALPVLTNLYKIDEDNKARVAAQQLENNRLRDSEFYKSQALQDRREEKDYRRQQEESRLEEKQRIESEKKQKELESLTIPGFGVANNADDAKRLKEGIENRASFNSKIKEMIQLREKHDGGAFFNREDVARGKQLSKDALLAYKNMAKLGVLSQADQDIVEAIIPSDPLEYNSPLAAIQGQDPTLNRLKKFNADTERDFQSTLKVRLKPDSRIEEEVTQKKRQLSEEDMAALEWANSNPEDPRAAEILRRLQ